MVDVVKTLIEVVIFTSLIGTISALVVTATENLSGAASTMIGLTTLFIVIGFITAIVKKAKGGK